MLERAGGASTDPEATAEISGTGIGYSPILSLRLVDRKGWSVGTHEDPTATMDTLSRQ